MLLSLSFVITGGCATSPPIPVACEKPQLRGETWADVAILSVEQAGAIDICNIRNGVDSYKGMERAEETVRRAPVPSPAECGAFGVYVPNGAQPRAKQIDIYATPKHLLPRQCGSYDPRLVGCTVPTGSGAHHVYYASGNSWALVHELCHAVYATSKHTMDYKTSRNVSE